MSVAVIVPVKALGNGKSRLTSALSASKRKQLCIWMVGRTLGVLSNFRNVAVVSDDPEVEHLLRGMESNVRFLYPDHPHDLNHALSFARDRMLNKAGILVVPIDLVHLDQRAIAAFLADAQSPRLAPDRTRQGTNLLYLPMPMASDFRFSFGTQSRVRHAEEADRLGQALSFYDDPRTAFDLDTTDMLYSARITDFRAVA